MHLGTWADGADVHMGLDNVNPESAILTLLYPRGIGYDLIHV